MRIKKVGQITIEEKNEIQALFERKNGLTELAKIITSDNSDLYEKFIKDLGDTSTKYQSWWDRMAAKYNWESLPDGSWDVDFNTCDIYLNK